MASSSIREQRSSRGYAACSPKAGCADLHENLSAARCPLSPERGFSLIEMMISITIGLVIVAALVSVLISNSQSAKTNDRTSELQSNGRYALDHLKRELRLAGYRGYTANLPESGAWITPAITYECGTALNFAKNIRQAVWGANDSNPFSANCLSDANARYDNTITSDVLVIRHVSSTPTLAASAVTDTTYLLSSYLNSKMLEGSTVAAELAAVDTGTYTDMFALQVYVYYIGSDDNDATVPALRRVALAGNAMRDQMVVSGIEQLQIEYATTGVLNDTTYLEADSFTGDHSANGPTDWDNVNSVRIWLLARNAKPEPGYTNSISYNLGSLIYGPMDDGFRRQVFTAVVQLRNFKPVS
ncbi:MAG: PilW family protein [Gallionella sp.]|nr:PilW family protein [Gallionella sp.]